MDRALQIIAEWERVGNTNAELRLGWLDLVLLPPLPKNVKRVSLNGSYITEITSLPESIIELELLCSRRLQSLCSLPPCLTRLTLSDTLLTQLPELPSTLTTLLCMHNPLQALPSLPPNLDILCCYNNQLKTMPYLPPKLILLLDYNNPFEREDMRWDGRNVFEWQTDTYEQIQKWVTYIGDNDVEERKKVWEDYFAMFE